MDAGVEKVSDKDWQEGLRRRSGFAAAIMLVLFLIVALQLLNLQVIRKPFLVAKAESQQLRRIEEPARRGEITDRDGLVLAQCVETESVFCATRMVKPHERERLARILAAALGLSAADLRRKLASGRPFWVMRGAKPERVAPLKTAKLASLSFFAETRRIYPQGRLAAHVVGFTDVDSRGLEGVEKSYHSVLAGRRGVKEVLQDARGRRLPSQFSWVEKPKEGAGLRLTLDGQLQHIAERELEKAWRKFRAKGASMVVLDPQNGEILAMASFPDYDPNRPADVATDSRRNRAVADIFEPGSTFKAVTAALALEAGVVSPNTAVNCNGGRKDYFGRTVRDHGDDHLGIIPFRQVMAQSSNVGTVEVALLVGPERLSQGIRRFGFGQTTGVDLPGETTGTLRPLEKWSKGSMAAIPFGQELSCNLLRVAVTYAAIANGGHLVVPHVVKELVGPGGGGVAPELRERGGRVMNESVRRQLVGMLQEVVDGGTGQAIALPGFEVAGKTGTAQKFDSQRGAYSMSKNTSTFVGFVPAGAPRFVAAVLLDEPQGVTLGGWTAGPVFRTTMAAALATAGLNPNEKVQDRQDVQAARPMKDPAKAWTNMYKRGAKAAEVARVKVPALLGLTEGEARKRLQEKSLRSRSLGQGKRVAAQFPEPGEMVLERSTVSLILETPSPKAKKGKGLFAVVAP